MRRLFVTIALLPSIFHRISSFNYSRCSTTRSIAKLATRTADNQQHHVLPVSRLCLAAQQEQQQQQQQRQHVTPLPPPTPPGFIAGPPLETKPQYEDIHGPLGAFLDRLFLIVFRSKMAEKVGVDSDLPADDYQGLIELTAAMNARFSDRSQVQDIAQNVLRECLNCILCIPFRHPSLFATDWSLSFG